MPVDNLKRYFIDAMAKHLPPSASQLNLLDIDGHAGEILSHRRKDLHVRTISRGAIHDDSLANASIDSVVAYDILPDVNLLVRVLELMRAGGRLIIVLPSADVSDTYVKLLENQGYVRILVEPAVDGLGVLIRGEKVHTSEDTLERIQLVATSDDDQLTLSSFRGRYVHLLIQQTPNKPVWKLQADETIRWHAVAIDGDEQVIVLGFTSLPKAVGFMQPAVIDGLIYDINKVGKFSKETIMAWDHSQTILLNPTVDAIRQLPLTRIEIDPATAEASDE